MPFQTVHRPIAVRITDANLAARQYPNSNSGSQDTQNTVRTGATVISIGAIVGIVIAVVAVICVCIGVCCILRRRKSRRMNATPAYGAGPGAYGNDYGLGTHGHRKEGEQYYGSDDATHGMPMTAGGAPTGKFYPGSKAPPPVDERLGATAGHGYDHHDGAPTGLKPAHPAHHHHHAVEPGPYVGGHV